MTFTSVFFYKYSVLGSFSNQKGDGNENVKKATGLEKRNNNFARTCITLLLYISEPTTTCRCLISRFVENVTTRQRLPLSFHELRYSLLEIKLTKNLPTLNEIE